MRDPLSPHVHFPFPPPPPHSSSSSDLPMLYYALVVVGTAAIVLILYNLLVIRWCGDIQDTLPHSLRVNRVARERSPVRSSGNSNMINFVYSFRYKKDGSVAQDECAVCLSVFEEGEELRQLPKCKHSFHAPCIDMWLHSHMDCPLCRSPVNPLRTPERTAVAEQSAEHSREVLLGPTILV